jgi:glycerophosphoryl diester phosphodiesterase
MLCIGHRGAKGYLPENTLGSIRKALDLGGRYIEIDVYNVEGHLVAFHDNRIERTTNGEGYIQAQSFNYLRTLDAGNGECIPTLAEVCQLINAEACLNIELKGPNTAALVTATIAQLVEQGWNKNVFLVSSFNHRQLAEMQKLDDEILLGALMCGLPVDDAKYAQDLRAFSVHPSIEFLDQRFIEDAHARNLKVFAYTVNHPEDIQKFYQLGVDGVFTDYPDRVLRSCPQGRFENSWLVK